VSGASYTAPRFAAPGEEIKHVPLDDNDVERIAEIAGQVAGRVVEGVSARQAAIGVPLPPTNQVETALAGGDAVLARARAMIRRPGRGVLHRQMEPDDLQDVVMLMFEDALRRDGANRAAGRSDIGTGPASFFR
jgi:hypothetical protein